MSLSLISWTFVFFLISCTSDTISSSSLLTDFHALITLKQGFQFPNPVLNTWSALNPSAVCSWVGIQCLDGRVIALDLTNMNLGGFVSPRISSLGHLTNLSLACNNFTREFQVEDLSNLKWLNISNNQLSGDLDWDYARLPNLEVFDAYNNNFTAGLPLGVLDLQKLRYLDFGGNFFYGEIPKSYGYLLGLEYLSLAGNDLQGKIPKELGNLTNLREIYLGYFNTFEGGIPKEFGKLLRLVHMDLSSCELHGEIPSELGNLKDLETLFLHINLLSGQIPKSIGNLTGLVNLDLSNNALIGEIPFEFNNLKNLKLLNLFMNQLHGSIPNYVAEFLNLETLGLWMNNFTGTIPEKLGQNGKLQTLDLSSNKLTGTIPQHLCEANQLKILILLKNFLFGPIPEDLGTCDSLVRVRLGENYLNGSIPSRFIYLPNLNLVELQNNFLSGTLPEKNDGDRPKLGQINLSNNLLYGTLPFSLSNFSLLQILLLSGNNFSGSVPHSIGEMRQLLKLDVSKNSFSGQIPLEIGNLTRLTYLDMSQNNLSGPVPPQISNARILNYLNFSRNRLNDTIPRIIASMKSLTIADFSFNDFWGRVPETGQFAFFNSSSFIGNSQLCGNILNRPCNFTTFTNKPKDTKGEFKLIFALGLLICSLVFASAAIIKARKIKNRGKNDSWKMTTFQKIEFSVTDILECIKDGNVIGRGGAGIVYHGKMPNGVEIAVKKLLGFGTKKNNDHDHGFRAEIQTLGNIRHRNIVRLLAFCSNKETNLLVYEYMKNGSLGEALHGKIKGGFFLGWNLRYKISIEAAKGLCYLHHDCAPLIVHRDVKSNNILLNSNYEAHVADFGLAKFLIDGGGASECMSVVAGSYGYIAPEYAYALRVDEKSDVYSFGVVLLELITGRRPLGEFGEGIDIVQWTKNMTNCHKENVKRIVDPRVITTVPQDEAMHMLFVSMLCVQENSVERPTMREVVQMLSEFPYHSTSYRTPSPSIMLQQSKDFKKEKSCPKLTHDLLI